MNRTTTMTAALAAAITAVAGAARAETPGITHALGVEAGGSNADLGGGLSYAMRFPGGVQLGLAGRAGTPLEAYVSGYRVEGGAYARGALLLALPLWQGDSTEIGLSIVSGARGLWATEPDSVARTSMAWTNEIGPIVAVHAAPWLTIRAGWLAIYHMQLDPTFDTDAMGARLYAGPAFHLSDRVQVFAEASGAGVVGYDGDGGKWVLSGTLGARFLFGSGARAWRLF